MNFFQSTAPFSSARHDWRTPLDLFRQLDAEFSFTLDACDGNGATLCPRAFGPHENALEQRWDGVVWMNPPYGKTIGAWIRKALEESIRGALVVCLVPARTDTAWWHDYCQRGEVRFIRGRLRFGGGKNSAPFPSAVVIFRPGASS